MKTLNENQQRLSSILQRCNAATKTLSVLNWIIASCVILFASWLLTVASNPEAFKSAMHSTISYVVVALFLIIVVAAAISREVFQSRKHKLMAIATALRKLLLQTSSYTDEHDNIQTSYDGQQGHSYSR